MFEEKVTEIVEAILQGKCELGLAGLLEPFSLEWRVQHAAFRS
jgi:hypothetical protein